MLDDLDKLWISLETDAHVDKGALLLRKLHSLGLHVGIDLVKAQRIVAVELLSTSKIAIKDLPKWKGIDLEITRLDAHKEALVLCLVDKDAAHIFNALIKDLDISLEKVKDLNGALELFIECLERWRLFFDKYGLETLSFESQRGLFGELYFLQNHILTSADHVTGMHYWRGHDRKNQDFSFPGGNVEVKTTIKKEHKTVIINSEKQLDDTGLRSLYLYCLSINAVENQGETLPQIVKEIREQIKVTPGAVLVFNRFLIQAGYLDDHEKFYKDSGYVVEREYFYKVGQGFPRIIDLPSGVGDIKYSVVLSACVDFQADINSSMTGLMKEAK